MATESAGAMPQDPLRKQDTNSADKKDLDVLLPPGSGPHARLFSSTSESFVAESNTTVSAEVQGRLPTWLHGTLYRNGPGTYAYGQKHLFDGYSLLQRYALDGATNTATFTAKYLESHSHREARAAGWMTRREFGCDPFSNIFSRAWAMFKKAPARSDNAGVHVMPMGGQLVALSEIPVAYAISTADLATLGPFDSLTTMESNEAAIAPTAHPLHHDRLRATINIMTRFRKGPEHAYDVVIVPDDIPAAPTADATTNNSTTATPTTITTSDAASDIAAWNAAVLRATRRIRIPIAAPSYHHSFSITDKYVIIHDSPMRYSLSSLVFTLASGAPITDFFPWDTTALSAFHVVSIDDGKFIGTINGPPLFMFHQINAYETVNDKGEEVIVMDLCAYKDAAFIKELTIEKLQKEDVRFEGGKFRRFHLNINTMVCSEDEKYATAPIAAALHELPRVNDSLVGRKYRYAWAARVLARTSFDAIVKFDVVEGNVTATWMKEGCFPGEPVFVPRPGAVAEDDGVIVAVVLDSPRKCSALAVLDAATLEQLAWIPVAGAMPLSFHGTFTTN